MESRVEPKRTDSNVPMNPCMVASWVTGKDRDWYLIVDMNRTEGRKGGREWQDPSVPSVIYDRASIRMGEHEEREGGADGNGIMRFHYIWCL
jgi:hypothetical protein